MHRSSKNPYSSHPSPLSMDYSRTSNALAMKPPSAKTSSHQSSTGLRDDSDADDKTNRPLDPSRSRSLSNVSIKSIVIEGRWQYREHDDDRHQLKSMGIANLVRICHDIMHETLELTARKQERRKKTSSISEPLTIVKLDKFKKTTDTERNSLRRGKLFDLMRIVYEAASTSASISNLIRIWREASKHNSKSRRSEESESLPLISYEGAFQHLIRRPNDQILQIALHASLISTFNQSDLRRLGKKLGIDRNEFDIESIRESTKSISIFN